MMNSNSMSSTAPKALGSGSSSNKTSSVPGLPDLPDTNAPLQSVQEDAAAAIRALRSAVDYNGRKKVPSKEPVWRPGVSSHGGAAAAASAAGLLIKARHDGGGSGDSEGGRRRRKRRRRRSDPRGHRRRGVRGPQRGAREDRRRRRRPEEEPGAALGSADCRAARGEQQQRRWKRQQRRSIILFLLPGALPAALDRRLQGQDQDEAAPGRGERVRGAGPGISVFRDAGPAVGARGGEYFGDDGGSGGGGYGGGGGKYEHDDCGRLCPLRERARALLPERRRRGAPLFDRQLLGPAARPGLAVFCRNGC